MARNIALIVLQYLNTADWADGQDLQADGSVWGSFAKDKAFSDCSRFIEQAGELLTDDWDDTQIGHDLWLTRNGHGAGFWDRDLPNADALADIARGYGELSLFVDCNDEIQFGG